MLKKGRKQSYLDELTGSGRISKRHKHDQKSCFCCLKFSTQFDSHKLLSQLQAPPTTASFSFDLFVTLAFVILVYTGIYPVISRALRTDRNYRSFSVNINVTINTIDTVCVNLWLIFELCRQQIWTFLTSFIAISCCKYRKCDAWVRDDKCQSSNNDDCTNTVVESYNCSNTKGL